MAAEDVPAGPLAIDTDAFSYIHMGRGPADAFSQLVRGHPLALSDFLTIQSVEPRLRVIHPGD